MSGKVPVTDGTVSGLFAGVGGLELGLHRAGYQSTELCEIDPYAQAVLKERFPDVPMRSDITTLQHLAPAEVVTAGFPCQDLSMAGNKVGITGERSGLVASLLRLLQHADARGASPRWLVIENVQYMLHLQRGRAMRSIVGALEELGYSWAYRVVDARAFGVHQRRLRVVLLASQTEDPRPAILAENRTPQVDDSTSIYDERLAYGFYWTEGKRGLGWAVDAVPTIKGGSTLSIPSPPAIWIPATGEVGTPDIRDLERLQGLPEDWTAPATAKGGRVRWGLVGNAVCGEVSTWLGQRLRQPSGEFPVGRPIGDRVRWPNAAWGAPGMPAHVVERSTWPVSRTDGSLRDYLRHPIKPLSLRAATGYLRRTSQATALNFPRGLVEAVREHAIRMADMERETAGDLPPERQRLGEAA